MYPQYVAPRSSSNASIDAGWPQARPSNCISYLSDGFSRSFPVDCTQAIDPQNARRRRQTGGTLRVENRDRRLTCLRASRAFLPFPCLPLWQHVARTMQVTSKSSWSSTPCPSQSSQSSPANITDLRSGQAAAPVPTLRCSPNRGAV